MTAYTRFCYSRQWFMRLIQWRTNSKWGHVEHVLSDGSVIRAWFPGGVQHLPVGQRTDADTEWCVTVPGLTPAQIAQGEAFLLSQVGVGYDVVALLGFWFGANWSHRNKWICSKLEDAYYRAMGVDVVGDALSHVTPGVLAESPRWVPVP